MVSDNVESAVVIFAVILMNAVLGTVQHEKAQKSLDSLKSLSSPSARVIRDGLTLEILSSQVVPGDLIALEAGSAAADLTNGFIGTVVMIISAYFFIADRERLTEGFWRIIPFRSMKAP